MVWKNVGGFTFVAGALTLLGCDGLIGDAGDTGGGTPTVTPLACNLGVPQVAPSETRRLNEIQFRNAVRQLLGHSSFDPELEHVESPLTTRRDVDLYRDAAELALQEQGSWTAPVFPCDPSAANAACAQTMIRDLGARAFRRPLHSTETAWLDAFYGDAEADLSSREALELTLEVMLQVPQFLYVAEAGVEDPSLPAGLRRLSDAELATRLALFLWNDIPDPALQAAVADGSLGSELRTQVDRMLNDPRAEARMGRFLSDYLLLNGAELTDSLESLTRDPALYPEQKPALFRAMQVEIEALFGRVFRNDRKMASLFTSREAYLNEALAEVYGVSGVTGSNYRWVNLDESERAGILTRAGFLATHAHYGTTAPANRGVTVLEQVILCSDLGDPPPEAMDAIVTGGDVDVGGEIQQLTVRQDLERQTSDGVCVGCHNLINPVGGAFEAYDAVGAWQAIERHTGLPVDYSGAIPGEVDVLVSSPVELSEKLASDPRVVHCFAEHWFEAALGRQAEALDTCSLDSVQSRFEESGGDLQELIYAIVESDSFQLLNTAEAGQ